MVYTICDQICKNRPLPENCVNLLVPLECAILGQLIDGIGAAISGSIAKLQDAFHLPHCSEIDAFLLSIDC